MGPFVSSYDKSYILLAVDYVLKWVEAVALPTNDAKSVVNFLKKNIFTRFGTPRAIISDGGSICEKAMKIMMMPSAHLKALTTPMNEKVEQLETFYVPPGRGRDKRGILFYKVGERTTKPIEEFIDEDDLDEEDNLVKIPQYFSTALKKLIDRNYVLFQIKI